MFKLFVAASFMALAVTQHEHGPVHGGLHGAPANGHDLAQSIPFQYGYDIVGGNAHSGDFKQTRQETGDGHGNVKGSYGYTDAYGNQRRVDYVADVHGFRAEVKTNEPGTDSQSPADVQLHADPPRHDPVAPVAGPSYGHGPH